MTDTLVAAVIMVDLAVCSVDKYCTTSEVFAQEAATEDLS